MYIIYLEQIPRNENFRFIGLYISERCWTPVWRTKSTGRLLSSGVRALFPPQLPCVVSMRKHFHSVGTRFLVLRATYTEGEKRNISKNHCPSRGQAPPLSPPSRLPAGWLAPLPPAGPLSHLPVVAVFLNVENTGWMLFGIFRSF